MPHASSAVSASSRHCSRTGQPTQIARHSSTCSGVGSMKSISVRPWHAAQVRHSGSRIIAQPQRSVARVRAAAATGRRRRSLWCSLGRRSASCAPESRGCLQVEGCVGEVFVGVVWHPGQEVGVPQQVWPVAFVAGAAPGGELDHGGGGSAAVSGDASARTCETAACGRSVSAAVRAEVSAVFVLVMPM